MSHDPRPARFADVLPDVLDQLSEYKVVDDGDDDPVLLRRDGSPVDTWRESYPYPERLDRASYDREKRLLPGMRADVAVLDQDLFTISPGDIGSTSVVMTVAGGTVVYGDR